MKHPLTASEVEIVMDITFLFNSVLDLRILSNKFLQMLGKLVPYEKAAVFLCHGIQPRLIPCAEIRCEKTLLSDYIEIYHTMDYLGWLIYQGEMGIVRESDKIEEKERAGTKFYKEFMKKYDINYRILFNLESSGGELLGIGMFFRSSIFEDFTDRELEIMAILRHHFSMAIENSLRFEDLTRGGTLAQKVYRDITDAVIVLNNEMEITYTNQQAEKQLEGLGKIPGEYQAFFAALRSGCLSIKDKYAQTEENKDHIESVSVHVYGGMAKISLIPASEMMASDSFEFLVVFSSADAARTSARVERNIFNEPDVEANAKYFFTALGKHYSLTKREIEIIGLVIEGLENRDIAERLHISLFTVKSHLQNGYAKLGIKNRQEALLVYTKYIISEKFRQEFETQTRKDVLW